MDRRTFIKFVLGKLSLQTVSFSLISGLLFKMNIFGFGKTPKKKTTTDKNIKASNNVEKLELTDAEWKLRLSPEEFHILRQEGTERPFTSHLNNEKRTGKYVCRGCEHELFTSEMKYDSGTGWPSFFTKLDNAFETKTDYKLIYPRTEYHCAKCGGHHGHVFKDGPPPTNERWCNNGIALKFIPKES